MTGTVEAPARAEAVRKPLPGGRRLSDGRYLYWWRELGIMAAVYLLYEAVRNANEGGRSHAYENALQVIDWQRALGINWEEQIQDLAQRSKALIIFGNYFYGSLYVVVTLAVLIWLYRKQSDDFPLWRNTLIFGTMLALLGFRFFPLMPPRLLPASYGFTDTLAQYPAFWSFGDKAMATVSNQYAAMPSLHCAWALWVTCAMYPRVRTWWVKTLAALYTVVTVLVVVITGNHYLLDGVGGFAIIVVGYAIARAVTRAGRSAPAPPETAPAEALSAA